MIRIMTDSTSDIPVSLVEKWNILVAPLTVNFEDGSYKDGVDLTGDAFFEKLAQVDVLPTTSQVSIGEFVTLFERELETYDAVVCINLSSELSGTYNAAVQAKEVIGTDRIHVIDSRLVAFALGMVVVESARRLEEGASLEAILSFAESAHRQMANFYIIDTMDYLLKGGRLSKNEAFLGNLLNIKPVLTIEDGVLKSRDKARGRKKAVKQVFVEISKDYEACPFDKIAVYRSAESPMYEDLIERISSAFPEVEIIRAEVGTVVGTHAGPGCAAITYFTGGDSDER